jgi:predicted phosphodiesterase
MIAIISDIHSNLEALVAVLDDIKKKGISEIYCCGDIVGYGANPNECIELVKKNNIISTMGNHDCLAANPDEINKIENLEWSASESLKWTAIVLTEANKNYLRNLPKFLKINDLYIVHGSPRDPLWDYSKFNVEFPEGARIFARGHSHKSYVATIGDSKVEVNVGSVGQPREEDNDPRARYCVINNYNAEIIKVTYDIESAAGKIKQADLPSKNADRLFLSL